MTDYAELIARQEAAMEGVTPGPWHYERSADHHVCHPQTQCTDTTVTNIEDGTKAEADARFIAAARDGWPEALAALKAVIHERDEARKAEKSANAAFDIGKSFHDLVVKERDLARYQLEKARAEAAALRARVAELEGALDNAARMAEEGILSMDGGLAASEIRSLYPSAALRAKATQEGV
jgi:hypothetical protein